MNESNMGYSNLEGRGISYQPPAGEYLQLFRFDLKDGTKHLFPSTELLHIRVLDAGFFEFLFHTHQVVVQVVNFRDGADRLLLRQLVWFQELSELEAQALTKGSPAVIAIDVYPLSRGGAEGSAGKKPVARSRVIA